MQSGDYTEAEKYIFLGLLLKKRRPGKLDERVLEITRSRESLERKIEMILRLDEIDKLDRDVESERPKDEKHMVLTRRRGRRKKKPNIYVIDPSGDIYNLLQSSLLRKKAFFNKLSDNSYDIELINEIKPDLLIVNQTYSLKHFALEINQLLKPNISLIVLSWYRGGAIYEASKKRLVRFIQKPLNVAHFEQTIRELTG